MPVCVLIIAVSPLSGPCVGNVETAFHFDAKGIYLNDADSASRCSLYLPIFAEHTAAGMIADIQSTAEMHEGSRTAKICNHSASSLPLLIMYPFFQKYFDQGKMAL